MTSTNSTSAATSIAALGAIVSAMWLSGPLLAADVDFAHDVAPVLKQYCGKCHTGTQKKGGLSLNDREMLMSGGESGPAIKLDKPATSELLLRIQSTDPDLRMPPEGDPVPADKVAAIKGWLAAGAKWEDGFTFGERLYEPPLHPRRPALPPAVSGRENPIDHIIDADLAKRGAPTPPSIDDATFARRVYFDLVGLLPTPEELDAFLKDASPTKRDALIRELLSRDVDYAEHWLTFWNDLLRNDYTGTGFITGGRTQITKWLYRALVDNLPYDEFTRQLIAPPTGESNGFINGIRWRGEVSAGQTVEIQFAQSVAQSFLGLNLKCASCHDSFVDRWTLDEAYGLAAIYSTRPLEIHRCDKPIGKTGQASWLFPEIGNIDPKAAQPERLKQLAQLLTHPDNGRFTRTIVNRFWHRLMGRGIVHPTDAMQTAPWNADLLDFLAVDLSDHQYDLKRTLYLIASSQAYQSQSQVLTHGLDDRGYVYGGPRAKRLTAEQFVDAVWRITQSGPSKIDAPISRGKPNGDSVAPQGKWIWSVPDARSAAAGESITFRRKFDLPEAPTGVAAALSCDNSYTLFVNGKKVGSGTAWSEVGTTLEPKHFKQGANEILIVGVNGGDGPNPAGLYFEVVFSMKDKPDAKAPLKASSVVQLASDDRWEWTKTAPDAKGKFDRKPQDWQPAAVLVHPDIWAPTVAAKLEANLVQMRLDDEAFVRASLVKSDFLMRTLGRPNRDQIVSVRPDELSTLEAIDLSNGETLAATLAAGAKKLAEDQKTPPEELVRRLFRFALSRDPDGEELSALTPLVGSPANAQGIEDVLWMLVLHPEFLLVR